MTAEVFDYDDDDIDDDDEDGGGGGELLNGNYDEKTSAASFQQALMQWRQQGNSKKPAQKGTSARKKKKKATHEAAVDTVVDANGELNSKALPNIEFHSSKLTYGEKLLVKKYRRANKNGEEFFDQRATKPNGSAKATPRKPGQVPSLPEIINLNGTDIEIEVEWTCDASTCSDTRTLFFSPCTMNCRRCAQTKGMYTENSQEDFSHPVYLL